VAVRVVKLKPWWDTRFSRRWEMRGMILHLLGKRIAYVGHNRPDNDSWTGN
jgi:hypothetical protein